ncbi:unnamed protein product [Vitrella brassicaformis CCMP3155]|uniref:Uncharacterized protein n=2 Tax=Vitrella brassicaformis TaxID=1169539 RepID=A0A0G4EFT9_VITBC|nr:unnamed protein product [Vitrella brassicaformis CCMP3155]|eukprot:CEL95411.1 unnamed protein product [Vitrella brassicaformis CCMP3155]
MASSLSLEAKLKRFSLYSSLMDRYLGSQASHDQCDSTDRHLAGGTTALDQVTTVLTFQRSISDSKVARHALAGSACSDLVVSGLSRSFSVASTSGSPNSVVSSGKGGRSVVSFSEGKGASPNAAMTMMDVCRSGSSPSMGEGSGGEGGRGAGGGAGAAGGGVGGEGITIERARTFSGFDKMAVNEKATKALKESLGILVQAAAGSKAISATDLRSLEVTPDTPERTPSASSKFDKKDSQDTSPTPKDTFPTQAKRTIIIHEDGSAQDTSHQHQPPSQHQQHPHPHPHQHHGSPFPDGPSPSKTRTGRPPFRTRPYGHHPHGHMGRGGGYGVPHHHHHHHHEDADGGGRGSFRMKKYRRGKNYIRDDPMS